MEGFDMRRNKMLIDDGSPLDSKLARTNLEFTLTPYKNGGFIEVSSQVQMITDSLLACLQMSKCRPLRRVSDVLGKTKTGLISDSFNQTEKETPNAEENTVYVSHMLRQDNWYRKFQEWNSIISQEVLIDSNVKIGSLKELSGIVSQNTFKTLKEQADPVSMVDIVQGELRTLTNLAPSVSRTAANLSKWVSHYKECTRCHEKISLLEVLHRIQELNLYIAKKRKRTQSRSTQSEEEEKSVQELKHQTSTKSASLKQISSKSGSVKQISQKQSRERQVEKSLTLDPATIAEGNPGVQILLEVDPDKKKLYHFSTAKVNDISYPSEVQQPESSKDRTPSLSSPKLYSFATYFAPTFFARSPDSVLVLNNPIEVHRSEKKTLEKTRKISFINRVQLCENQTLQWTDNFCIVFFKKIGCLAAPETLNQTTEDPHSDESSDSDSNPLKELNERMEMKIVDGEVAQLRNLISEVQQSQIKLSKVLLSEGIFSQPLIKLTNPNLLEEESKTLKKISEIGTSFESTSLDALQEIINNVKEKCQFKNRLIGTVTRGLRHNIPKEWWEEIVGYTFEGSNTLNERDFEKVDGLLRQCSSYFRRQEKALEDSQEGQEDERPSEEEVFESEEEEASTKDSDQESEYMTGLEDCVDPDPLELSEIKTCEKPSSTSSFVQKILYEDACAGVAVMDLFVAIKAVKQNLDVLEERNNDFFDQIHHLNTETKVFMKEYEHLRYCITEFLNQMEGDMKLREVLKTSQKQKREKSKEKETMKCTDDTATKKSKELKSSAPLPLRPRGAPPSLKEKPPNGSTNLPEAMMVSFLAALVCLEKEQKKSSFLATSNQGGKTKLEGIQRQELHKPPEGEVSDTPSHKMSAVGNMNKKTSEGDADTLGNKTDNFPKKPKVEEKVLEKSNATDNSTSSDDDDNFREALSTAFYSTSGSPSTEEISSVNCMGDLKKEMMDKENESFVFKADLNPSEASKFATDISTKVIKTKRKKKEKVLQQHRQTQQESKKTTIADSLKFTVSTNSPMGVFDVTVVPHKKRRLLSKKPDSDHSDSDMTSSCAITEDSLSSSQIQSATEICDPKPRNYELPPKPRVGIKDHWTHKDLNLGFESAGGTSFSDEESSDAFVDAYMEPVTDDVMKMKKSEKGLLQELCFFWEKSTFFELFKCQPVYYSQVITKKSSEIQDDCKVDVTYEEKEFSDGGSISLNPGEKGEKKVVIEGQSSDLVIYIQVELEDESRTSSDISLEFQANSLGTQTAEITEKCSSERSIINNNNSIENNSNINNNSNNDIVSEKLEETIKLEKNEEEAKPLLNIWKCATENVQASAPLAQSSSSFSSERKKIPSEMVTLVVPKKLSVADPEILDFFEVMSEKEIMETQPEEIKSTETISKIFPLDVMAAKQKAHVWFVQNNLMPVHRGEIRIMTFPPPPTDDIFDNKGLIGLDLNLKSVELEDALKLIHKIESDVMDVKLSDALSILPRLETELRKHVEEKLKSMQHTESKAEDEQKKTPTESTKDSKSEASEGRLSSLLAILSSLEDAVKVNDKKSKVCGYDSSTVFQLLHALTDSIRQVEETPTVTNMSKTIDLASRLDVAIRGEESEIKPPVEYFLPAEQPKQEVQEPIAEIISEQNLKTTRKRIFQRVEDEAAVVEDRLERDFERLDRLERENDELLMFLEAFLQKTGRRVSELGDLKDRLKNLSTSLTDVYDTLKSIISLQQEERKRQSEVEKRIDEVARKEGNSRASSPAEESPPQIRLILEQSSQDPTSPTTSSVGQSTSILLPTPTLSHLEPSSQPSSIEASTALTSPSLSPPTSATPSSVKPTGSPIKWEPIKETVSGLLEALNTLKMKALEKKKFYMDILNKTESATTRERMTESQRSSATSFTAKQSDHLSAKIKKFKKIDGHSCYMAWSKPKGPLEDLIEGYHIYVNGKINHRVRNPERRQAVLYSVDFKHKADVQLYAITEKFPKVLLATYTHQND